MSNARGQHVDKTYLSVELAEKRGFIHRDYIAHCLRWSHVIKRLGKRQSYKTTRLLDVGCGRELPLASTLYSSRFIVEKYYGVDVGPVNDEAYARITATGKFPCEIYENTDVTTIEPDDLGGQGVNVVTCFEMLEHVEPLHMWLILRKLQKLVTRDARLFFSTPCWNQVDCAANHVNEIKYEVLGSIFEAAGYKIENVYGTFASQRDIVHHMSSHTLAVFEALKEYYDSNFLSCVFAPMYPAQSRNALWELSPHDAPAPIKPFVFPPLKSIPEPWGSSEKWDEFKNELL